MLCGASFKRGKRGNSSWKEARYCSNKCVGISQRGPRMERREKPCSLCGKYFQEKRRQGDSDWNKRKFCSALCIKLGQTRVRGPKKTRPMKACVNCGLIFHKKDESNLCWSRRKYCSKGCRISFPGLRRNLQILPQEKPCVLCGNVFTRGGNIASRWAERIFCSSDCQIRSRIACLTFAKTTDKDLFYEQRCETCGKAYIAFHKLIDQRKYCSKNCNKRMNEAGRSARKRGATTTEKDAIKTLMQSKHKVCGICGLSIPKNARFPHPKSLSIDHIIPISKGGQHTLDNVQLAHLSCNVRRGNRGKMQLDLFKYQQYEDGGLKSV